MVRHARLGFVEVARAAQFAGITFTGGMGRLLHPPTPTAHPDCRPRTRTCIADVRAPAEVRMVQPVGDTPAVRRLRRPPVPPCNDADVNSVPVLVLVGPAAAGESTLGALIAVYIC